MAQMEQLQSETRNGSAAVTSNLTRPQWQPPVWTTNPECSCTDRTFKAEIRSAGSGAVGFHQKTRAAP